MSGEMPRRNDMLQQHFLPGHHLGSVWSLDIVNITALRLGVNVNINISSSLWQTFSTSQSAMDNEVRKLLSIYTGYEFSRQLRERVAASLSVAPRCWSRQTIAHALGDAVDGFLVSWAGSTVLPIVLLAFIACLAPKAIEELDSSFLFGLIESFFSFPLLLVLECQLLDQSSLFLAIFGYQLSQCLWIH